MVEVGSVASFGEKLEEPPGLQRFMPLLRPGFGFCEQRKSAPIAPAIAQETIAQASADNDTLPKGSRKAQEEVD